VTARAKVVLRWVLTVFMIGAGANHFLAPDTYVGMMPSEIPERFHLLLVDISGVAEIAGGLGLVLPATRRLAAWGLVLLYLAVLPANINMAWNHLPLGKTVVAPWLLWARLPLQLVLIAWAWWYTRRDPASATSS
jgi:uncharacterized membrane protein